MCAVLTAMLARFLVSFEIFTFTLPIAVFEGTLNIDIVTTIYQQEKGARSDTLSDPPTHNHLYGEHTL